MSRSRRPETRRSKRKRGGYDYWSRRYGNDSMCNCPAPGVKERTNRAERRKAKQELVRD